MVRFIAAPPKAVAQAVQLQGDLSMSSTSQFPRLISGVMLPDETRMVQSVYRRLVAECRLPPSDNDHRDFAIYLVQMYFRGLVIEEKLYGLGVSAAKARYGDLTMPADDDLHLPLSSVLVVEDDYYIASEIRQVFEKAGARVLGPVSRTEQAMSLLESEVPDIAIIDLNLGEGPDFKVAEHLRHQAVPVCFYTAYRREDFNNLPESLRTAPWFVKPTDTRSLLSVTARTLG